MSRKACIEKLPVANVQIYIDVVAGIILRNLSDSTQQVLIAKRPVDKDQGGLWEFPGGKVEHDELPLNALKRELNEELGIELQSAKLFKKVSFNYPNKCVNLSFYKVLNFSQEPHSAENQEIRWIPISMLPEYQFPEANLPIVKALLSI